MRANVIALASGLPITTRADVLAAAALVSADGVLDGAGALPCVTGLDGPPHDASTESAASGPSPARAAEARASRLRRAG